MKADEASDFGKNVDLGNNANEVDRKESGDAGTEGIPSYELVGESLEGLKRGWQEFYLRRLERLVSLRAELVLSTEGRDDNYDFKARLIHKAIYSSFCDCIELDVKLEATELLKETVKKA